VPVPLRGGVIVRQVFGLACGVVRGLIRGLIRGLVMAVLLMQAGPSLARAPAPTPVPVPALALAPLKIYGMENKPVSFMGDGQPDGLVVELVTHIQEKLGRPERVEIIPWTRANALAKAEPNVMLAAVVRTPEREAVLHFVGPVFTTRVSAYAVKGRLNELRRKDPGLRTVRVGGQRSTAFVSLPRRMGYNVTDEVNSAETAAKMLMNRRFDLWSVAEELMPAAMERAGYRPDAVELAFNLSVDSVYFGFSRGTPAATIVAWSEALREMKRDGSFQKIHQKWLPGSRLPPDLSPLLPAAPSHLR
jgi:polar amino acid transport system substrate-binding protein